MQLHHIRDPHDPVLDDYRSLTDTALRRVREPEGGLYIAESAKVIELSLQAGHRPRSVLIQQKWADAVAELLRERDVPVYVVTDEAAEQLTGFAVHRGVMAAMHRPEPAPVADLLARIDSARPRLAVLEGLTDHTNVGAIFRSAAALGVEILIDPFVPAASLPRAEEVGSWVTLWQPQAGGHVGFAQGRPPGQVFWLPEAVGGWLRSMLR